MLNSHPIVDPKALSRNRSRFDPDKGAFLHRDALSELQDRLSMVNREFKSPVIVSGFKTFWQNAFPEMPVVPDSDTLALEAQRYDLVIHAMSLHMKNDPLGQLIQCQRALTPDGLFLAVFLGGSTLSELRHSFGQAEIETIEGLSPRVMPMTDIKDAGMLMQRAGFALPVADSVTCPVSYLTTRHLMQDLRAMGETNPQIERLRTFSRRATFQALERLYRAAFSAPNERIVATFEFIWLTGWCPGPDQPKALRPGSATISLVEALESNEEPL